MTMQIDDDTNRKSLAMTLLKFSKEKLFVVERCKMKDQKPWRDSSCNQDFAHRRGLEPKVKMSELGDALSELV